MNACAALVLIPREVRHEHAQRNSGPSKFRAAAAEDSGWNDFRRVGQRVAGRLPVAQPNSLGNDRANPLEAQHFIYLIRIKEI